MKEAESKWPTGSYIATIIGAATVLILMLYTLERGGSHLSAGKAVPVFLAITPFLFAALVMNFCTNPRSLNWLSAAIILQSVVAVVAYYDAIFSKVILDARTDLGMVPLGQFVFIGVAAGAARYLEEKSPRRPRRK